VPTAPATPVAGLVKRLAEKRAGTARPPIPTKEELLRPEFRFRRADSWLLLPELAKQLTSTAEERAAVLELMDTGAKEASRLFSAEGADNDIAAAAALAITQLWSLARQKESPGEGAERFHGQLVSVMAGPETAAMSDADKQRYWEYCIGFPVFLIGMQEVAQEPSAQEALRTIAANIFTELMGISPQVIDIGIDGIALSAAADQALAEMKSETPAAPGVSAPAAPAVVAGGAAAGREPTTTAAGVSGITYTAPTGWAKEEAGWATVFRATLRDVDDQGRLDPEGKGQHGGSIFVLPPRAMVGDAQATFEAVWREQFGDFELGDTIVHYRARLRSGLVIHYMGRFFDRKVRSELRPYGVLYLVDLGAGRVQPITAVVQPIDGGISMSSTKENGAYRTLYWAMEALLNSIQPAGGPAPYPSGGYFRADNLYGDWSREEKVYGGSYVNSVTGFHAGVGMHGSLILFRLGQDGTYNFSLNFTTSTPVTGTSSGEERHHGRYRLDGDVVLVQPTVQLRHPFTSCAVGIGTRQTGAGPKRMLVTVTAKDGVFYAPPLMPNGERYDGIMYWFVEK
jgi:hypothetical protein